MNKALHCFVYLFLALAIGALYFELELNKKRQLLTDRNAVQESYYQKIAKTIEKEQPAENALELKLDSSPVEAKIVDIPDTENLLDDYNAKLEQQSLTTYNWDSAASVRQLREVYKLDAEGKPEIDARGLPSMDGPGTEKAMLEDLFQACLRQQTTLNTTRAQLTTLREKLEAVVKELNELKPIARQDKVTIEEKKAEITKLEEEKASLEDQISKKTAQIEELNAEVTSLKQEVAAAKEEVDLTREELAKRDKLIDQLKKMIQELQAPGARTSNTSLTSLPAGDKGVVVEVNNKDMFCIIKLGDEAMRQLKGGDNADAMVPPLEMGVRRKGFNGAAGEFITRVKLRQEIKGRNFVICDILGSWSQDEVKVGDVIFAD